MVIYALLSMVDTFFVARLGSMALAALTFSIPIQVTLVSIASATGIGLTSLIARTLGAKDMIRADNIAWHGILICIGYALLAFIVARFYLDNLLYLVGCPLDMFKMTKGYLQIIMHGSIFIFVPIMLGSMIQGEGNTFLPMLIMLTGIVINVALDPLLIFGYGPIKGMGLNGSALATVAAQIFCSLQVIIMISCNRGKMSWRFRHFNFRFELVSAIYKVGFPTIIIEITGVFIMTVLNKTLAGYGNNAIAVLGIFLRSRALFFMPVYGLAQGAMPIAGFAYGNGNLERVKEVLIKTSVLSVFFTISAFIVMQYNSHHIISFFSQDKELTSLGVSCMRLGTLCLPLMGPIVMLHTVLQAVGKGTAAMWFALARNLLFFYPFIVLLPQHIGLSGVWLAFSLAELLAFILSIFFFFHFWRELQDKNKIRLIMLLNPGLFWHRVIAWLKT